jgi:hypothetical protein
MQAEAVKGAGYAPPQDDKQPNKQNNLPTKQKRPPSPFFCPWNCLKTKTVPN